MSSVVRPIESHSSWIIRILIQDLSDDEKRNLIMMRTFVDSMLMHACLAQGRPWHKDATDCSLCFKPKATHVQTPTLCGCEMCPRKVCVGKCHCSLCLGVGQCSICRTEVWRFESDGVSDEVFESVFDKNGCIICGLQFCDNCNAAVLAATHGLPVFSADSDCCVFCRKCTAKPQQS